MARGSPRLGSDTLATCTFEEAVHLLIAPGAPRTLVDELGCALAQPLNETCQRLKGMPGLTRDQLVASACEPYVHQLVAATRSNPDALLVAADRLAASFAAGRVVLDLAHPGRLTLLPERSAPAAFVRLLRAILDRLPSIQPVPIRHDPSYA